MVHGIGNPFVLLNLNITDYSILIYGGHEIVSPHFFNLFNPTIHHVYNTYLINIIFMGKYCLTYNSK